MFTINEAVDLFLAGNFCEYCFHEGECASVCRKGLTDLVRGLVKDGVIKQKFIVMDASGNRCMDYDMTSLCYAADKIIKVQKRNNEDGISELENAFFENFAAQKLRETIRMDMVYHYMLICKDRAFAMELIEV